MIADSIARHWPLWLGGLLLVALAGLLIVNARGGGETQVERHIERVHPLSDAAFAGELGVLLGPPFLDGNRVTTLLNGDEIFPAMLAAIRGAGISITFETYIYWSGDIGRAFADALAERARHGVKVHVLLDWVGSAKMDEQLIAGMKDAGVEVHKFHPPHWSKLGRLNNRTHRKLLVVDGRLAFTGGASIAPQWTGQAQDPVHRRDTHFQVEGPVVAQMQAVFMDNWIKVTGHLLHGPRYFAPLPSAGGMRAQVFSSSPSGGSESKQLMYLLAIAAATRSIDLSAAYFVPDGLTRDALLEALRRGVALRIVVPGEHIDSDAVRATWGPLLQAGAVIAEYAPTMHHCKVMIVDGLLVSVGSTNFDFRSFRLNDEATLNILDAAFAAAQTAVFEADLALSRRVSHAEWARRPLRERLHQRLASLIGSQLRLRRRDAPSSRTPPRQSRPAKSHDRMRVCPAGPQQRWRQARRSYLRSSCKTSPEGNTLSAISNLSDVYNKQLRAAVKELYVADELMTELAEAAVNEDAAAE